MTETSPQAVSPTLLVPRDSTWVLWLPMALFAVLWVDLVRQLSHTWEAREQYSYGWFVPFFAVYLFWRRWLDRPAAWVGKPSRGLTSLVFVLALALMPLRLIFEINTDWPLISWSYTGLVVILTLYAMLKIGGWPWVRHFVFPVAFILVSVTWPWRIEKGLTQNLMQVVASITVELLGLFNIPALQRGNLIEVATGVIGVDEACSGIRSFQSTLMAALLMGELYRLKFRGRAGLLICGLSLAFILNVVRTLLLSWQVNTHGLAVLEKWHDPAGLAITVACFLGLWALAMWLRSRAPDAHAPIHPAPSEHPGASRCASYLVAVGCWAIAALGATEAWYRLHDSKDAGAFQWNVNFPTNTPSYKPIELTKRVVGLMGHDSGGAASWSAEDGIEWSVYFFRWNPRSIRAVLMSRMHRPDVCLPATGMRQVGKSSLVQFDAGQLKLPFRTYTYERDGQTVYVFFCQWEDGAEHQSGLQASKQQGRLQSVLTGRRRMGQQTMEIILAGCRSPEEAEAGVRRQLSRLIRIEEIRPEA